MCTVLLPPGGKPNAINKYITGHKPILLPEKKHASFAT